MKYTQLNGAICLNHNVKIYVPSTVDVKKTIDSAKIVIATQELLSKMFGGASRYGAMGSWVSDTHGLVTEHISIVESYCTEEQLEKNLDQVLQYCYKLKKDMSQEAISLEVDNKLYLV